MNKIDNFFKEKLSGHSSPPSNASWSKIESGLTKKNNRAIWLKIAATLIIGGLSFTIWYVSQDVNKGAQELSNNFVEETPQVMEEAPDERLSEFDQEKADQVAVVKAEDRNAIIQKEEEKAERESSTMRTKASANNLEPLPQPENLIAMEISTPEAQPENLNSKSDVPKPVVIEYTLASIKIPNTETNDELYATAKKTGIKKVLEIAGEVRSGEGSISSLRQAKNELFAFNFIKEKEERNNK